MNILRHHKLIDTLLLLLLAATLIAPVFKIQYLDNWPSIESTFISDARMLAENMPHPGWQPLWYCGTRFDYIYPPALRYGTTLISLVGSVSTARAYHIYVGLFYIFGSASVYWLVFVGSQSRKSAWLSALAVALVSPCLILVSDLHRDSPWMIPLRLHSLMTYGEGPHISALSVLPAALAAAFAALRSWRPVPLALAGFLCAFTVANNFYGATALAIFFPIVVWSVWLGLRDNFIWLRALGVVALAYGLVAFWLTPSYVRITWINLKWVSSPGDAHSQLFMLAVIFVFCDASYLWANRRPDRIWPVFVMGSALILTVDVLGFFYFGARVLGEPFRLAPELDMALLLLLVLLITTFWRARTLRIEAVVLTIFMFVPAPTYLRHAYTIFVGDNNWEDQYQRRITKWVHENLPGERVMPSGTIRFWFDAWFDIAQPDGGSQQGLLNQWLPVSSFQIFHHDRGDISVLWLQALGTSAVIVPDSTSLEYYHDYQKPEKFRGLLSPIFDDRHGTVIYRVPRIYRSLGRVVDRANEAAVGEIKAGDDIDKLKKYVSLIEAPQPETPAVWSGFDALQITAQVGEGQSVLLQETYDPAWRAYEDGASLPVHTDHVMGFMLIDVPPGAHTIVMRFETPLETYVGQLLLVVSLLTVGGLVVRETKLWKTFSCRGNRFIRRNQTRVQVTLGVLLVLAAILTGLYVAMQRSSYSFSVRWSDQSKYPISIDESGEAITVRYLPVHTATNGRDFPGRVHTGRRLGRNQIWVDFGLLYHGERCCIGNLRHPLLVFLKIARDRIDWSNETYWTKDEDTFNSHSVHSSR